MPYERRDILFSLTDIDKMMSGEYLTLKQHAPKNMDNLELFEVIDAEALKRPQGQARFTCSLKKVMRDLNGIVLCAWKRGLLRREEICFAIPEQAMLECLVMECGRRNIVIPRAGEKTILAEDKAVGLRIEMKDDNMKLEF